MSDAEFEDAIDCNVDERAMGVVELEVSVGDDLRSDRLVDGRHRHAGISHTKR